MNFIARGPWIGERYRDKRWKRLVLVGIMGAAWQFNNLKEIPGYRWDYVGYDLGADLAGALLAELLVKVR